MKTLVIPVLLSSLVVVAACSTAPTERNIECVGATATGAVVGGLVGNQLGGGSGKDILTAGGAAAGGLLANKAAGCS